MAVSTAVRGHSGHCPLDLVRILLLYKLFLPFSHFELQAAQNVATNVNFKLRSAQNNAGIGGLFGGFGNYSGVDNQSASGDVESLPSNSQVAVTEPQVILFLL